MHSTGQEVVLHNGLPKEHVALLRAVTVERFPGRHVVDRLVHGLDYGRTERTGDVADAEAYHVGPGMRHLEGVDFLCYVGKEIILCKFQVMFVYQCHIILFIENRKP